MQKNKGSKINFGDKDNMKNSYILKKIVRILPPEEKRAAETICDELTTTPIPQPPVLPRERR